MGKAIAELYAQEGAEAVVKGINENNGVAKAVQVNVAKQEDTDNMIDTAVQECGTLDILVNNAGIMDEFEAVGDIPDKKWDLIFDINTKGVMRAMRKAISIFLEKKKELSFTLLRLVA